MNNTRTAPNNPYPTQTQKGVATTGVKKKSTSTEREASDQTHQMIPRLRTARTAAMTAMSEAFRAVAIFRHYLAILPAVASNVFLSFLASRPICLLKSVSAP